MFQLTWNDQSSIFHDPLVKAALLNTSAEFVTRTVVSSLENLIGSHRIFN